ncbi:MAG: TIGR02584 family CRISPR-associated protein [Acidobacteriia bacterium]|nr:TIGR02584 family CRISPR-associated protein [Methyloceanibacter sp.]MCL6492687.1 TIGR02584 family CRISPR-associated protein [Terriglobia bacterium]
MMEADPAHYSRRILLAVTGLSPQVVTETLWALAERRPPFIPTEAHVLTTREGGERIRRMLLEAPGPGRPSVMQALADELGQPAIATLITPDSIRLLCGTDGTPLSDILTEADNIAAADAIAEAIRALTADPSAALHVSLAGGRKTMGVFAGFALSLFGRPQDRLSHVLVPEPFQNHPEFFFPSRVPRRLRSRENEPVSTAEATVVLAEIPFLRLREAIAPADLVRSVGFASAVQRLQRRFEPPRLVFDLREGVVRAHGEILRLTPNIAGFLLWLAELRRAGEDLNWRSADVGAFLRAIAAFPRAEAAVAAAKRALRDGFEMNYVAEKKARLNKLVAAAIGPAAALYRVETIGRRPHSRYRLATPPDCITIIPARASAG